VTRWTSLCSDRTNLTTTICDLVALGELRLRLVTGAVEQGREIRSVHTTDLQQPGRYLLPGELVLTNGLWHGAVPTDVWISELSHGGAAALGFGLGTPHERIPADLADACERRSLPLIEIPEDLSFAAISDAVAADHAEDHRTILRQHLERSRTMLRGLSEGRGIEFLLEVLRNETGLDAALVSPSGRVLAAIGQPISSELSSRTARITRRRTLPSEVEPGLTAFGPSGDTYPASWVLVVWASLSEIDDEARVVINQVTDHIELESGWRRSERQALSGITKELVDLLRAGGLSSEGFDTRAAAVGLDPQRPITVIAFAHEVYRVTAALDVVGGAFALASLADSVIALAQPTDDDAIGTAASAIADMGDDPTLGGGGSGSGAPGVARSLSEALMALNLARGRAASDRVVSHGDLGSHSLLLALLDPEVLRGFRKQVLGPVEEWDLDHGTELLRTVREFLSNRGRSRATASNLHIHHNTLRYRLRRVELLTGRDLDEVADRLDVQIALLVPDP
jgi:Purine catabolism regulatory protein-like family/PucR C-terminal helix-turn-helix domain/GGDEF-like domain